MVAYFKNKLVWYCPYNLSSSINGFNQGFQEKIVYMEFISGYTYQY